jgi:hypothetical protein
MKIKKILQNCLLSAVATIIALLAGEMGIRTLKPVYDYRDRSLLFSSPTFKLYTGGSVRYIPHEKIREVAVYNDKIEYDVQYATNNLGCVDTKEYGYESLPGKRYYAFVGDSFTTGVNGGRPWVPRLRNSRLNVEVYNFGVAAAGFDHFYRLLDEMKHKVKITDIVIVAITDDFFRGYWHPVVKDGTISFCSQYGPHPRCEPIPVAGIIPATASGSEVRAISRNRYREIRARINELNAANGLHARLESLLYDDSAIYYYSRLLFDTYRRSHQPSNIEAAVESLRKIRTEFPRAEIRLIHLPQKYEVKTKSYSINVTRQIEDLGISYYPALEKCRWSEDMFFVKDGHPNSSGYENITRCVSGYLFGGSTDVDGDIPKE